MISPQDYHFTNHMRKDVQLLLITISVAFYRTRESVKAVFVV